MLNFVSEAVPAKLIISISILPLTLSAETITLQGSPLGSPLYLRNGSWEQAVVSCYMAGAKWIIPMIRNTRDYHTAVKAMEQLDLKVTWLQLRRRRLDKFLWINGDMAPYNFSKLSSSSEYGCAYLDSKNENLHAGYCFALKGVVCQKKGCVHCDPGECERIDGACYYRSCNSHNWESGRAYCRSRDLDIAVFSGPEENTMRRKLSKALGTWSCQYYYWIGLRREEWIYPGQELTPRTDVYWTQYQPETTGDCSVMEKTPTGYKWKAANCCQPKPSFCLHDNKSEAVPLHTLLSSGRPLWKQDTKPFTERSISSEDSYYTDVYATYNVSRETLGDSNAMRSESPGYNWFTSKAATQINHVYFTNCVGGAVTNSVFILQALIMIAFAATSFHCGRKYTARVAARLNDKHQSDTPVIINITNVNGKMRATVSKATGARPLPSVPSKPQKYIIE